MGWVPDDVVAKMRGSHLLGIFLRVDTDPALHLWLGVGDMPGRFDSIDPDGTVYLGGGQVIGIPTLEVLINGTADVVEFTLSGLDMATAGKTMDSIPAVRGVDVHLGIMTLDQYYQPMGRIIPIWHGTASHVAESSPPVGERDNPTLTLALSVVTGEATRSRPSAALWSSAQQKALHPGDLFCDNTSRLARGVEPAWPVYSDD